MKPPDNSERDSTWRLADLGGASYLTKEGWDHLPGYYTAQPPWGKLYVRMLKGISDQSVKPQFHEKQ